MRGLAIAVLELAFLVSLGAAVFMVVEWVAALRFAEWTFRIGPHVMHERRAIALPPAAPADSILASKLGEFVQISPAQWLFRPRSRGFAVYDWFAVKGTMTWNDGEAIVEGRVPLSSVLFLDSWIIGWCSGSFAMGLSGQNTLTAVVLGALAIVAGAAVRFVLVPFEVRRASTVIDDFEGLLRDDRAAEQG